MFSSNFSFFQENRAFQNALKISKSAQKCLVFQRFFALSKKNVHLPTRFENATSFSTCTVCFPTIFRISRKIVPSKMLWISRIRPKMRCFPAIFRALQKKTCFPTRSENATSFSTCSQKCNVFQQFFAFPGKSCLPKCSENFKISPKMPCFPAIFHALQKKRVFQHALKSTTSFSNMYTKCYVFHQFFAFPGKSCLPKCSENFKISPKCFVFQRFFALSKKIVFSNTL